MDARYRLTNLIADVNGDYWNDPIRKVVLIDTQTGDVKPTPYIGNIQCFVDGNLALLHDPGKIENRVFSYGKYGETLQTWQGGLPKGMYLHVMSCRTGLFKDLSPYLKDGRKSSGSSDLRMEHGFIAVIHGQPLPAQTEGFSPELQRLMQQPFMQKMTVESPLEQWVLKKPNGDEVPIPNNPGESIGVNAPVEYLPFMGAYFMPPYSSGRPFDPEEFRFIPRFARILYPDGRVERVGVPDVIAQAYMRRELGYSAYMSKRGIIWQTHLNKRYKGELKEGFYLDLRDKKILKRLPYIGLGGRSLEDGCTVFSRGETTQMRPYALGIAYNINLCTGEQL